MRCGRSFALWAAILVLVAPGCAGTARRPGAVGGGAAPAMPRLIRPADPIARLAPAKVSVGPFGDPGSYTPASPLLARSSTARGGGRLTVGGGQIAEHRPTADTTAPAADPARLASRDEVAVPGPRGERPRVAALDNGWPVVAGADASAVPEVAPIPEVAAVPEDAEAPAIPDASAFLRDSALAATDPEPEPGPVGDDKPAPARPAEAGPGTPPVLAAGIDLETYAAPAASNDPEAQRVSIRRPIAALSNALAAARGARSAPESRPEPGQSEESKPEGPKPEEPEPDPLDGPFGPPPSPLPDEPEPVRDDVRPAVSGPSPVVAEEATSFEDPYEASGAPSPFEREAPRSRTLSKLRQFRQRFDRDRLWDGLRSRAQPPTAQPGARRLLPKIGRDDVGWLSPGL